ncbi:MAG: FlgD immunoglobulin-like domain containing protein, partial [Candidatus Eiseniibacteriota bacterium]
REVDVKRLLPLLLLLCAAAPARGAIVLYTDESLFLTDLAALGEATVFEGFEADSAWGAVRTTIPGGTHTAPSVTHQGMTWTSNNDVSEVTTGHGPALSGDWGFFCLPHGNFPQGIGDGWVVTSPEVLQGMGGWIETNTPPASVVFYVDGVLVDFEGYPIGTSHRFLGVIDVDGFHTVEVLETEGTPGDQKFIFSDDYTFGVSSAASVQAAVPGQGAPRIQLAPNTPNPFNPSTRIHYRLDERAQITLTIHDVQGRRVRLLLAGEAEAGEHSIRWNGRGAGGEMLPSGVYFCRLVAGDRSATRSMILAR